MALDKYPSLAKLEAMLPPNIAIDIDEDERGFALLRDGKRVVHIRVGKHLTRAGFTELLQLVLAHVYGLAPCDCEKLGSDMLDREGEARPPRGDRED